MHTGRHEQVRGVRLHWLQHYMTIYIGSSFGYLIYQALPTAICLPTACYCILFYSILGCVVPLQELALRQSLPSILVHTAPCCPTMSSLQRRFGLPTDLTPSVCHSVLLIVHLFSFIRAMSPALFHCVLVTYWTMSVTLVLCLMVVLRILSFSLTLSILLSQQATFCISQISSRHLFDNACYCY